MYSSGPGGGVSPADVAAARLLPVPSLASGDVDANMGLGDARGAAHAKEVADLQAQLAVAKRAAADTKVQHDQQEAIWRGEATAFKEGALRHHTDLQRRLYDAGMDKAKVDEALRESKDATDARDADRDKKRKTSTAVAAAPSQ